MFSIAASLTGDLTLDDVLQRLSQHDHVTGLVVTGSEGRGTLKPESDYDLLVILDDCPPTVDVLLTTVDGRLTDVIFRSMARVDTLLTQNSIKVHSPARVIYHWVTEGRIAYDPSEKLTRLQSSNVRIEADDTATPHLFNLWYAVNFNLAHGARMLQSDDEIYLMAMDMRFLYMLDEVMQVYMQARDIPQRGEKATVRYLQEHHPDDLALYQKALHATDRREKFAHYRAFAEIALAPLGGVWKSTDVTAFNTDTQKAAVDFWRALLG